MLLSITGSNKKNRKLVKHAAKWYAEKLMGKRLMSGLEILAVVAVVYWLLNK